MDISLVYLQEIKQAFPNQPWVYLKFEKLVKAFLCKEIDGPTITAHVTELFSGHPDLLVGFTKYLPALGRSEQYALQVLNHQRQELALCFVNTVEKIYLGQPRIFAEFLKINLDPELHPLAKLTKMRALFHEHPELTQTFQGFMPAGLALGADLYKIDPATSDTQHDQDH